MKNVGILGATGYAGQQLLGLLRTHSQIKIEFIASHSYGGQEFSSIYENYSHEFNKVCISNTQVEENLNKIDLLPYLDYDLQKAKQYAKKVNPNLRFFEVSASKGEGLEGWINWLKNPVTNKKLVT